MKFSQIAVAVGILCGGIRRPNAMYSGLAYLRAGGPMSSFETLHAPRD